MENIDIVKVIMVRDQQMEVERFQIQSPSDAVSMIRRYLDGADREHFVIVALDTKHFVTAIHTVSIGTLDASIVHPREVFKVAILANASGIIVAHNHPSGISLPSDEDIQVTKRLVEAGKLLGIDVVDHIVIGDDSSSLRSMGYM